MTRVLRASLVVFGLALTIASAPLPVAGQDAGWLYINTTEDLPISGEQCLPQQVCTLRAALLKAEGRQGVITACFDPSEVPEAKACPERAQPLSTEDVNYDPDTGTWTLEFAKGANSFDLSKGGTIIDFTRTLNGWDGPEDNRMALDADITREDGDRKPTEAFIIEGSDNVMAGFEIRGTYSIASVMVRRGASNNQFGPGLVWAGMSEGVGLSLESATTVGNKIIGSWCGITGDGTVESGLRDHCIRIFGGASANVIGGTDPASRNIFSANQRGSGVVIEGSTTRDNLVQGNWFGLSHDGREALPNDGGVQVLDGALGTQIIGNVMSGNRNHGVAVSGEGTGTIVEDNVIGRAAVGGNCVPNGRGITIDGGASEMRISGNTIHCNDRAGIIVRSGSSQGIHITENSITKNSQMPIDLATGANGDIQPPHVEVVSGTEIRGRACPSCVVEFFTDPAGEAEIFEGRVTGSETDGTFVFAKPEGFKYNGLRATMTDGTNTSGFSEESFVPRIRPTHTPFGYKTPTPRPTDDASGFRYVYLPWASVGGVR